jgi:hypothetical protein
MAIRGALPGDFPRTAGKVTRQCSAIHPVKDDYTFDFLELAEEHSEWDLENGMLPSRSLRGRDKHQTAKIRIVGSAGIRSIYDKM